jgi:hypothetical protein
MARRSVKRLARAIRALSQRAVQHGAPEGTLLGEIVGLNPLRVDLIDLDDDPLDSDDLLISQDVRRYHRYVGLEVGDNLILAPHEEDFIAVGVVSDTDVFERWEDDPGGEGADVNQPINPEDP